MPRRHYIFTPIAYPPEPALSPQPPYKLPHNHGPVAVKTSPYFRQWRYRCVSHNRSVVSGLREPDVRALRSYADALNRHGLNPLAEATLKGVRAKAYKLLMSLNREDRRSAAHCFGIALDAQHRPLL